MMHPFPIERWLYASEGDSLDFKQEQYRIKGASDEEKGEFIKDILAMANSWRTEDGFIVLGIVEQDEKPNRVVGITEHIDDATFQQIVGSKILTPCAFHYSTFTYEGKTLGVFRIPVQHRPLLLKKNFGKLKAETAYVRRGSSTAEATVSEVAKMGRSSIDSRIASLDIQFFDPQEGKPIGDIAAFNQRYIEIIGEIPKRMNNDPRMLELLPESYTSELVEYHNFHLSFFPVRLSITNTGTLEARNVRVEMEIERDEVDLLLDGSEPQYPSTNHIRFSLPSDSLPGSHYDWDERRDHFRLSNSLELIHSQRTLEVPGILYLRRASSGDIRIKTRLFFDGQPSPIRKDLVLSVADNRMEISWEEFKQLVKNRPRPTEDDDE